jgi:DNA mismatch endonuclease (patch repair protein)
MINLTTTDQRRRLMQKVRREKTAPEIMVAKMLKAKGMRFRQNTKQLPGKPDFYFPSSGAVLFVHGCFWHGHTRCKKGQTLTKSNTQYWREKIERNKDRDRRVARKLRRIGLSVFTVWACEIHKHSLPSRVLVKLQNHLV